MEMFYKAKCIAMILFLLTVQFAVFVVVVQRKHKATPKPIQPLLESVGGHYNTGRLRYAFHSLFEHRERRNHHHIGDASVRDSPGRVHDGLSTSKFNLYLMRITDPEPSQRHHSKKPIKKTHSPVAVNTEKNSAHQQSTISTAAPKDQHISESSSSTPVPRPTPSVTVKINPVLTSTNLSQTTWQKGSFCEDFLTTTFKLKSQVCTPPKSAHLKEAIECFGSPHSGSMGTCTLRNIAVVPSTLMKVMYDPDRPAFEGHKHSVSLLRGLDTECKNMTVDNLSKRMEKGDYVFKVVQQIMSEDATKDVAVCDAWVNETVFFFTAHRFHIFFRFLDYYNMHKLIGDLKDSSGSGFRIIRISGSDNYHFPEFDGALFPEARVQILEDLKNVTTCFKKVILVPKSYASPIFQCKNRLSLRSNCYDCDGTNLTNTAIRKFSDRVLKACSSRGQLPGKGENRLLVVVSRTPYLRNQNDKLNHFERVLDNEVELVKALKTAFTNITVSLLHLENLTICEQVAYARNADVFLGVHGSGLVHLWWMRDDAVLYELEPHYQMGNPTFRMLSKLAGRRYHNDLVTGGFKVVHSDIKSVVKNVGKYLHN